MRCRGLRSLAGVLLATSIFACAVASPTPPSDPVAAARPKTSPSPRSAALTPALAERFAGLALACVHREYPNLIHHVLEGPGDVRPPHALTPAFHGCYDWHSAVHGHWLLARLVRLDPGAPHAAAARAALDRSLSLANVAGEVAYLEPRATFERPYGLAWLLQLAAELHAWKDPDARRWSENLRPLTAVAVARLSAWLPKLTRPIRVGEHSQTAFAMGLALDYARIVGDRAFEALLVERARAFHGDTRGCPIDFEPSAHDFLSPCLAEADLMRRVLPPSEFAAWLNRALPEIPSRSDRPWLEPVTASDRADGKLAHLDGLNLSRAWMLEGVVAGLPAGDRRIDALDATVRSHARAGLSKVSGAHYEGGHWLGSFAVYLTTARGRSTD